MDRRNFLGWGLGLLGPPVWAQSQAKVSPINRLAEQLLKIRTQTWDAEAAHGRGVGFLFGPDLTNEEGYLWAKLARLIGSAHLELVHESAFRATALAMESTNGYPAAPNHWREIPKAQTLVLFGRGLNRADPLYRLPNLPKRRWVVTSDAPPDLTASTLRFKPGTELALLGGWIRYLFAERRWDEDFIQANTNGFFQITGLVLKDGVFSGLDPATGRYRSRVWRYVIEDGEPARAETALSSGTVLQILADLYAPYTVPTVANLVGIPAGTLARFYQSVSDPSQRPLALAYGLGPVEQSAQAEQIVRALAILHLLTGQTGPLVHLAEGRNPQGLMDVGANGTYLPGYSGQAPRVGEDYATWSQTQGAQALRRLQGVLQTWFGSGATATYDLGFHWLPQTPRMSLRQSVARGQTRILVCVGCEPKSLGWDLRRLETLVQIGSNPTSTIFIPAGSPGSITDLGRTITRQTGTRSGLTVVDSLWKALATQFPQTPDCDHLVGLPWPRSTPEQVRLEMTNLGVPTYEGLDLSQGPWRWPKNVPKLDNRTPENRGRLLTVEYQIGVNPDTGIGLQRLPQPQLGPAPLFYWPSGSKQANPFYPKQPTAPVRTN